jgi:hypothetical protein
LETEEFKRITCLDQVSFVDKLMRPEELRARIQLWAEEEIRRDRPPPKSGAILEAVLYRGDAAAVVGTGDRPLRLPFPATLASRWVPGLFPERNLP